MAQQEDYKGPPKSGLLYFLGSLRVQIKMPNPGVVHGDKIRRVPVYLSFIGGEFVPSSSSSLSSFIPFSL